MIWIDMLAYIAGVLQMGTDCIPKADPEIPLHVPDRSSFSLKFWSLFPEKLHQKKIPESIIDQVIASTYSQYPQSTLIIAAAADWRRTHVSIRHDPKKLFAFLIRRGFDYYEISSAIKKS